MPIMRKMNLINVHFWTYLKSFTDSEPIGAPEKTFCLD